VSEVPFGTIGGVEQATTAVKDSSNKGIRTEATNDTANETAHSSSSAVTLSIVPSAEVEQATAMDEASKMNVDENLDTKTASKMDIDESPGTDTAISDTAPQQPVSSTDPNDPASTLAIGGAMVGGVFATKVAPLALGSVGLEGQSGNSVAMAPLDSVSSEGESGTSSASTTRTALFVDLMLPSFFPVAVVEYLRSVSLAPAWQQLLDEYFLFEKSSLPTGVEFQNL
jgi:hypothetical protein